MDKKRFVLDYWLCGDGSVDLRDSVGKGEIDMLADTELHGLINALGHEVSEREAAKQRSEVDTNQCSFCGAETAHWDIKCVQCSKLTDYGESVRQQVMQNG